MSIATGASLSLSHYTIDDDSPCFVIAEIGHNHQGSLQQAFELFEAAAEAGAQAVKLQKRDNRSLYTSAYFSKPYDHPNSFGATYGEHREALEFGQKEYRALQQRADELGLVFFATAFDHPSADFLAELDMPAYKIASADLTNTPLLRHVAQIGKPMILSTGAAKIEDVRLAYETVMPINSQLVILQCTAGYPADFEELDLRVIETYREMFPDVLVGLSSHDNGIAMPVAAYVLGARVIEKHFTLNRALRGTDHAFSLEPQGLQKLCRDLERVRVALGDGEKKRYRSEVEPAIKMGKKLVAARSLPAGHVIGADDIAAKSPGDGMPPYELDRVVGCRLRYPVEAEMPLSIDLFEAVETDETVDLSHPAVAEALADVS